MSNFIPHFTPLTNKSNEKSPPHHVIRNFFCSDLASNLCTRICMFGQRKYLPSRLAQICSTNPIPIRTNETLLVNFYTKHKFAGSALISIFFQKLFFYLLHSTLQTVDDFFDLKPPIYCVHTYLVCTWYIKFHGSHIVVEAGN